MIQEPQDIVHKSALLVIMCWRLKHKERPGLSDYLPSPSFLSCKPQGWSLFLHLSCSPAPHFWPFSKPPNCISWASRFRCPVFGPDRGLGGSPHFSLPGLLVDSCRLTGLPPPFSTIPIHRSCQFLTHNSPHWLQNKIKISCQDASGSKPYLPFWLDLLPHFLLIPSRPVSDSLFVLPWSAERLLLICHSSSLECPHPLGCFTWKHSLTRLSKYGHSFPVRGVFYLKAQKWPHDIVTVCWFICFLTRLWTSRALQGFSRFNFCYLAQWREHGNYLLCAE